MTTERYSDGLHLTNEEVREVTGYTHLAKQRDALARMGIPFRVNPVGRILVIRSDYTGKRSKAAAEPNWDALDSSASRRK